MAAKTRRVRTFSNGLEFEAWCEHNCERCTRSSEAWGGCPIQDALSIAHLDDGLVSAEIAERMGYSHERSREPAWRCGEFEARP